MSNKPQVLVANAGTLHMFPLAAQLHRHGLLKKSATTLHFNRSWFDLMPPSLRRIALRQTVNRRCEELDGMVETMVWPELLYLAAERLHIGKPSEWIAWRNQVFCRYMAERCLDEVNVVWSFDTSSYELFLEAKRRGIRCVLDLSIAHPALGCRIMAEYARRRPELAQYLELTITQEQLERREAEMKLADCIVVGSRFSHDSLVEAGIPASKVHINPYGVDLSGFYPVEAKKRTNAGMRFLFVSWFSARKGIYDLLDAWVQSRVARPGGELLLAGGTRQDLRGWSGALPEGVSILGRVPHTELPDLYRSADVFIFPSLFEGYGRVVLEAMASGLPAITTRNTVGLDLIEDGRNGFIVPVADVEDLAKRIAELSHDRDRVQTMGCEARRRVLEYTWSAYGDRCAAICQRIVGEHQQLARETKRLCNPPAIDTPRVLVANAGTLRVFPLAAELRRQGLLKKCATTLHIKAHWFDLLPQTFRSWALRRTINRRRAELDGMVETMAWPELLYLTADRFRIGKPSEWIAWRNQLFCRYMADRCLNGVNLVWSFDTSSYELFLEAKRRGIRCVLDLSIAHPALGCRIMSEYARQHPELAQYLELTMPEEQLERREAEIELADCIVVGSRFSYDSLIEAGVPAGKVHINPYGVDLNGFFPDGNNERSRSGIRFLFVSWFSARKGIYDLLAAWVQSQAARSGGELLLAGGTREDLKGWSGAVPEGVSILGRLPHSELPELYRSADVFIFPSLFEGYGRVVLEAMASGLPAITTRNTAGPDLIDNERNGFIVPVGDVDELARRIAELSRDGDRVQAMGREARRRVLNYTWSAYGDRCGAICRTVVGHNKELSQEMIPLATSISS